MKAFNVSWKRQKGKLTKSGYLIVLADTLTEAVTLFNYTYPDRVIEAVYTESNDVLFPGQLT